ncbi:hypothetical protein HDV03_003123 [Kappamyces sp. JEL0829]|nr:hypothetical protein HDV03_003108 [Kappamyces sp. JEL0829]KAJ3304137.1 hypothetical protein HDV03_003123 [Kappamyces sp. JEL0829]
MSTDTLSSSGYAKGPEHGWTIGLFDCLEDAGGRTAVDTRWEWPWWFMLGTFVKALFCPCVVYAQNKQLVNKTGGISPVCPSD